MRLVGGDRIGSIGLLGCFVAPCIIDKRYGTDVYMYDILVITVKFFIEAYNTVMMYDICTI